MIVSNKFLRSNYGKPLRDFLVKNATIEEIVDFAGFPVFPTAKVRTLILITTTKKNNANSLKYFSTMPVKRFNSLLSGTITIEQGNSDLCNVVQVSSLQGSVWNLGKQAHVN